MALEIIKLYIALISDFFALSDMAVVAPPASPANVIHLPPFIPPGSNSLVTSHYLVKLLAEITDCVNDITAIELSDEASVELKNLVDSSKWKFEDSFCAVWLRGTSPLLTIEFRNSGE